MARDDDGAVEIEILEGHLGARATLTWQPKALDIPPPTQGTISIHFFIDDEYPLISLHFYLDSIPLHTCHTLSLVSLILWIIIIIMFYYFIKQQRKVSREKTGNL